MAPVRRKAETQSKARGKGKGRGRGKATASNNDQPRQTRQTPQIQQTQQAQQPPPQPRQQMLLQNNQLPQQTHQFQQKTPLNQAQHSRQTRLENLQSSNHIPLQNIQPFQFIQTAQQTQPYQQIQFPNTQPVQLALQQQSAPIFPRSYDVMGCAGDDWHAATALFKMQNEERPVSNKRLTQSTYRQRAANELGEGRQFTFINSTGPPAQAPAEQRKKGSRKRKANEEEEEEDEQAGPRKSNRMGRPKKEHVGRCEHCIEHGIDDCDVRQKIDKECTQCSEYRFTSGNLLHACAGKGYSGGLPRQYSVNHPMEYPNKSCRQCMAKTNAQDKCDMDMLLGYNCTSCNNGRTQCKTEDGVLLAKRPGKPIENDRWFRHACDTCFNRATTAKATTPPCSWLGSRSNRQSACLQCRANGVTCFDGMKLIEYPPTVIHNILDIPDWRVRYCFGSAGWAELKGNTRYRRICQRCNVDNAHCRISNRWPKSACSRCSAMGIDCIEVAVQGQVAKKSPIHSLSIVGFGPAAAFHSCLRCVEKGRNCDRQRPCDSCIHSGEQDECDRPDAAKTDEAYKRTTNCFRERLQRPGPLYYLAMGYGPGGVNDIKDGSLIEHWIGPIGPIYARKGKYVSKAGHTASMENIRNSVLPQGAPPQTLDTNDMPSCLTVERIRQMIRTCWPGVYPMRQHPSWPHYTGDVWTATLKEADAKDEGLRQKREKHTPVSVQTEPSDGAEGSAVAEEAADEEHDGEADEVDGSIYLAEEEVDLYSDDRVQRTGQSKQLAYAGSPVAQVVAEELDPDFDYSAAVEDATIAFEEKLAQDCAQPSAHQGPKGDHDVDMSG